MSDSTSSSSSSSTSEVTKSVEELSSSVDSLTLETIEFSAPLSFSPAPSASYDSTPITFDSLTEIYSYVRDLYEVDDPVVTPHRSKYRARVILDELAKKIQTEKEERIKVIQNNSSTTTDTTSPSSEASKATSPLVTRAVMELTFLNEQLGLIDYYQGLNHLNSEEISSGEKLLNKSIAQLRRFEEPTEEAAQEKEKEKEQKKVKPLKEWTTDEKVLLPFTSKYSLSPALSYPFELIDAYNHIGITWSNRNEHEKAYRYLSQAQEIYLAVKLDRTNSLQTHVSQQERLKLQKRAQLEEQKRMREQTEKERERLAKEKGETYVKKLTSGVEIEEVKDEEVKADVGTEPAADNTEVLEQLPEHIRSPELWARIEQLHTMTLFYLAQVYTHLKKRDLAAIYCHLCLNRQLRQGPFTSSDSLREWVTNCIGLSFFYTGRKMFQQAHHCLLAAQHFVPKEDFLTKPLTPQDDVTPGQLLAADLCRAWGSFFLKWLQRSRDNYIDNIERDDDPELIKEMKRLAKLDREFERHAESQAERDADEDEDELFGVPLSELGHVVETEEQRQKRQKEQEQARARDPTKPSILTADERRRVKEELKDHAADETVAELSSKPNEKISTSHFFIQFKSLPLPASPNCPLAVNYEQARDLFKLGTEWFQKSARLYVLDGYVSDHIPIIQDLSLFYKLLAVFDPDPSNQTKMHKRRIDLLQPVLKDLSVASYQELFQQLSDEIATTYGEMVDLKIAQHAHRASSDPEKRKAQVKINELSLKSIQFYNIWLQSWSKDGSELKELDPYYHRWYLSAMFKIARCYSKIYHDDPKVMNHFIKLSFDAYNKLLMKAKEWNAEHCMEKELELCREMVQLLPYKMDRVVARGSFQV